MRLWCLDRSMVLGVCLLATAWGVRAGPNLYDLKSSAQLSGLKVTVVDLDPDDGIEAGFSFVDGPFLRSSRASVQDNIYARYLDARSNKDFGWVKAYGTIGDRFGSAPLGFASAQVAAGEGTMALPNGIGVEHQIAGGSWLPSTTRFVAAGSISTQDIRNQGATAGRFVVTANTRVTFEALATSAYDLDIVNDPFRWNLKDVAVASLARLSITGSLYNDAGAKVGAVSATDALSAFGFGPAGCGPVVDLHNRQQCSDDSKAWQRLLSASFETGVGQEFQGTLAASVFQSVAFSTPEPGTWALMLTGLVAVGVAGSRRSRAQG